MFACKSSDPCETQLYLFFVSFTNGVDIIYLLVKQISFYNRLNSSEDIQGLLRKCVTIDFMLANNHTFAQIHKIGM